MALILKRWIQKPSKAVYSFPKSVQKSIPIKTVHENGIFEHNNEYSFSMQFTDINYQCSSPEDKENMFLTYQEVLRTIDAEQLVKITLVNKVVKADSLKEDIFIKHKNDGNNRFRDEINRINLNRISEGTNCIVQEKYITFNAKAKNLEDVKTKFTRTEVSIKQKFADLGSDCTRLSTNDRLRIIHDFFRGSIEVFNTDVSLAKRKGHDFKDTISPDGLSFENGYFRIGEKYARAICLKEYPTYLKDELIAEIMDIPKQMVLSIDLISKSKEQSLQFVQQKILGVETEIANSTKKAGQSGNWNANIPLPLSQKRKDYNDIIELMHEFDQRLILLQITIVHVADSLEELNHDTETIISIGNQKMCTFGTLMHLQEKGLNTALPYGLRYTETLRTLTTENAAIFIPFVTKEVFDVGGICYGINQVSKNLIIADRRILQNGNGFVLGVPGGGKSFIVKYEIDYVYLSTDDDIIIVDPEREYGALVDLFGGTFIHIAAGSRDNINALEMNKHLDNNSDDPIPLKCEFILTLVEMAVGNAVFGAKERSLVEKCARKLLSNKKIESPTLKNLHDMISENKEEYAQDLAIALELFVDGSLNIFSKQTNVDMDNRLICYDIRDLGTQMKGLAMLVILENIFNRVTYNRSIGKRTWIYIDEMWSLFRYEFAGEFLNGFWRRCRKYGGIITGLTQNTADILKSDHAREMLSNSEFVIMLNQASMDKNQLATLLNISDTHLDYIDNAKTGMGLIRRSSVLIPFDATFDTNTELYKAMTTKIEEVSINGKEHGQD